jgi:hypothetical protein
VVARVPHFWSVDLLANGALHWSALRNQSESFLRLVSDYFYLLSHWLFYFWLCRHSKKNREWNYETDKQYSMLLFLKSSHIMFFFFSSFHHRLYIDLMLRLYFITGLGHSFVCVGCIAWAILYTRKLFFLITHFVILLTFAFSGPWYRGCNFFK